MTKKRETKMSYFRSAIGVATAACLTAGALASSAIAQDKGSIISFNGPAGEAYIGRFITGIKETAELKGFDIKVFENQFNQAEQDQQVQQVLAAGQLPDVFIWWPSDATAGLGSLRALHKTGVPVLKINQLPNEQDKQFIFGYAGPDDRLRARNAGYMMREAAAAKKAGRHGPRSSGSIPISRWSAAGESCRSRTRRMSSSVSTACARRIWCSRFRIRYPCAARSTASPSRGGDRRCGVSINWGGPSIVSRRDIAIVGYGETPIKLRGGRSSYQLAGDVFAEIIEQPVFNLFYPCGLPFQELDDYP